MSIYFTPLRYPGGKTKMFPEISLVISEKYDSAPVYVEPFSGGFGLGLKLLHDNKIERAIINDFDFHIYSFWKSIITPTLFIEFMDLFEKTKIDIDTWKQMKKIYLNSKDYDISTVGFSTFFLNRCNRSGILKANPIGGINQTGKYLMDCRFNKKRLRGLLLAIHSKREQITVFNEDALTFIPKIDTELNNAFFFIDPPYVKAGNQLYESNFTLDMHKSISDTILHLKNPWVLTYDNSELIKSIYQGCKISQKPLQYSLENKRIEDELFITK